MKVFSLLSLKRNLVNFNKHRDKRTDHHLVWPSCSFRASHHTGVGYCLFVFGFTRTSLQINGMLHTFL